MALAVAVLFPPAALQAQNSPATAAAVHRATLEQYCVGCHSGPTPFAGLNLQPLDASDLEADGIIWEKMLRKLRNREMPPAGMPRPDAATYEALVKYIETGRDRLAETKPNPGRTTLHRLNRTEYANAIRDLFALEIDVAELLPADDIGYGDFGCYGATKVKPPNVDKLARRGIRFTDAHSSAATCRSSWPQTCIATLDALQRDFAPFRAGWFSSIA